MSIPSRTDVEAAEAGTGEEIDTDIDYAYYEDGDNIVIYNFREVPAGDNGYIEMSYNTSDTTFAYADSKDKEQAPFTCVMTVRNGEGIDTKSADPVSYTHLTQLQMEQFLVLQETRIQLH